MSMIFIGMPVYNGARFLQAALDSLINQRFTDWTLLISDNASEDDTPGIAGEYCARDQRIQYCRQERNMGAPFNFKFVLDQAAAPYFMWAAADDLWHPDFLFSGVANLETSPGCGMAFANIVNVDSYARTIRNYTSFTRFTQGDITANIRSYVLDSEILGKANLFYSLFRLEVCKAAYEASPLNSATGSDMCLVLAALVRTRLCIDERVLFYKRYVRGTDREDRPDLIVINNPENYYITSPDYHQRLLKAVQGTEFYGLVEEAINLRFK